MNPTVKRKEKNSKERISYNTTLKPDLINKAKLIKTYLLILFSYLNNIIVFILSQAKILWYISF